MSKIYTKIGFLLVVLCSSFSWGQNLMHYWNFNSNASVAAITAPSISNISGASLTATISGISAIDFAGGTGQNFNVLNLNAQNTDASGTHLRFNDPIGSALVFALPTTGYENAIVKFATRRSGSGAGTQVWSYSTDGTNYTFFANVTPNNGDPALATLDFSALAAADNNANFKLKVEFQQGTGGTVGNNRFDNFTVQGTTFIGGGDTTSPTVTFLPLNGAINVIATTNPTIAFNESVRLLDNSAITNTNIDAVIELRLNNASGALVPFDATFASNTITINPTLDLANNQLYYVALLSNTIEDTSNNAITTAQSASFTTSNPSASSIDLSTYVRVGRYDLPEPTRTAAPTNNLLCQEASAVAYNWDTDTLFITADGSTSVTQVSKTGVLINTMTMAQGDSPQGTDFYDTEGITYVGNGQFVMSEERDRQLVKFTYAAGTTLTRANTQTVKIGTFVPNTGTEGLCYDPITGGFICLKEIDPIGVFQTNVDFAAGTATNGSATTINSVNLFDTALLGFTDVADVFVLANIPTQSTSPNLLVLSQENAQVVNIDRNGNISSTLTIVTDAGNPLNVASQQHEGITMDNNGNIYIVSENGGGDINYPQLWVYAPSTGTNLAPTAVALSNTVPSIIENSTTTPAVRVADIVLTDDGLGTNTFSLTGADANNFQITASSLFIKPGTVLDFETKSTYNVTVNVDDTTVGATPDASVNFVLSVTDLVNETPQIPNVTISEVAPWGSGNSPAAADWFEVTNNGTTALNITDWKVDDNSNSFNSSLPLTGITSIAPGESVIFLESSASNPAATVIANFKSLWFGANPPASLQVGTYQGSGIGLSTGGDAVNLYDAGGILQANVTFGASPTLLFKTFNNAVGLTNTAISLLSEIGVNDAFVAINDANEIGSPGAVGRLFISEVAPWSSGNSSVGADWFEVTNTKAVAVDITGWKVDDNSQSPAAAVALNGITSINPGESVIFIETNDLAGKTTAFLNNWFGTNPTGSLRIGNYTGSGIGLGTGGDQVNLYNTTSSTPVSSVLFGSSPAAAPYTTFDNKAGVNSLVTPITQFSAVSVNGAFIAANSANEIGSPGTIITTPCPTITATATPALATLCFGATTTVAVTATGGTLPYTVTGSPLTVGGGTFTYTITDAKGCTATATTTVTSLPAATVDLSVSTNTASETAATTVTITATASAAVCVDETIAVDVTGTGITAADYTLSNTTITIPAGATTGSVTFTVVSDNAVETQETAVVTISNPSSGIALGTTTTQNIAISDFVFTLQVLHASDFEGAVDAVQDAPRFAAIVDQLEESHVNTIKLSSGDNYIPGPFLSSGEDASLSTVLKTAYESYYNTTFNSSSVNLLPSIGRPDISILNFIGIEASALGNHEFDLGTTEVRNIIRGANSSAVRTWFGAQFPYLSSNLNFSGDSNLSAIATTDKLRLNTSFMSNPTETTTAITNKSKLAPSTIIMKGGQKIGIVGCTTQILASISSPGATTVVGGGANDMTVLAGIVQPVVDALIADGCNKVILLSHLQQIAFEKDLATKLNGVDIIIAAGSNTLLADANDRLRAGDVAAGTYPFLATDLAGKTVPVVNTDGNYKYVGRLVVDFDSDGNLIPSSIDNAVSGVYAADAQGLNDVWGANVANAYAVGTRGYQVKLLCDAIGNVINSKDGNLFGKTSVFLEGRRNIVRTEETNLGNITAEANLWLAKFYDPTTVISIKNGGGIRSAIGNVIAVGDDLTLSPPIANPGAGKQSGDISQLDIENSLRFNNQLSLVTLTATGLRSVLEHAVAGTNATATPGQFAQVAGVRYSYNFSNAVGSRILNAVVTDANGNIIDTLVVNGVTQGDLSRTFRVVTLNFLAGGGDSYPFNTLGTSRSDLNTIAEQGPAMASFANAGSEQDAFAEFMKNQYTTTPYGITDTALVNDCRIQRVPARTDNVLPPSAGTNGTLSICNGATLTTSDLFAALGGTPASGGTWSPAFAGAGVYTYTVTSPSCSGAASATVTVNVSDLAATSSAGTIACNGGTTTVTVAATGGTAPYTGTGTFTVDAGDYSYTVTDANGCTSIVTGTVTEPSELTNTATISSCNNYTWSVNNQTYTESGTYTVIGTNAEGCTDTKILVLTITNETITSQPAAPYICNVLGATTSVSVATTAINPGYVWQSRVVNATNPNPAWTNLTNNANYAGVNSATLNITKSSSSFAAGIQYRVLVNSSSCQLASNSVSLTVISTVRAGAITSPTSVCIGDSINFTLSGYAGTSIQWQSAPNYSTTAPGVFTDIPGATGSILTITGATAGMNKAYRAVVSSTCSNTAANTSTKIIKVDPTTVAGTVTGGGAICSGGSGALTITGFVGTIQWEYSIDGGTNYTAAPALATGQILPFSTTSTSNSQTMYRVNNITQSLHFRARVLSGTCLTQFTNAVQFNVATPATVGVVSSASSATCNGTGTTLSITGSNQGTISWQRRLLTSTMWTTISNSNVATIATGNLTAPTMFRASVTSGVGTCLTTVISNEVTVRIVTAPVSSSVTRSVTTPSGVSTTSALCTSFNVAKTLTVGASSVGMFQWQRSTTSATTGFVDIAGATGPSYTINEASVGQNWYRAVATNGCGLLANGTAVSLWYKNCPLPKMVSANTTAKSFDVNAYPNPYSESFNLYFTTSSQERVSIKVYDMIGKLVDSREVATNEMSVQQVGNNMESGIYNVVVTQGTEVKTLRVIKR